MRDGREEPEKAGWCRVDGGNFGSRQATLKRNFLSFSILPVKMANADDVCFSTRWKK